MFCLLKTELKKLRRCNIYYVGIVVLPFSPLLSILQQQSMNSRNPAYGFADIADAVIWYNMSLFMPVTLMVIGGYMINREYTDDTLKNILSIPVSYKRLMMGKTFALLVYTILYSFYSFLIALCISALFFPKGITVSAAVANLFQIVGIDIFILIAILPFWAWSGGKKNRYLAGIVLVFVYGLMGIPVAGYDISIYYPVTAGFSVIRYESGAVYRPGIPMIVLAINVLIYYIIIWVQDNTAEI